MFYLSQVQGQRKTQEQRKHDLSIENNRNEEVGNRNSCGRALGFWEKKNNIKTNTSIGAISKDQEHSILSMLKPKVTEVAIQFLRECQRIFFKLVSKQPVRRDLTALQGSAFERVSCAYFNYIFLYFTLQSMPNFENSS